MIDDNGRIDDNGMTARPGHRPAAIRGDLQINRDRVLSITRVVVHKEYLNIVIMEANIDPLVSKDEATSDGVD